MMMVDGKIEEREFQYCVASATRLGFAPTVVTEVVTECVAAAKEFRESNPIRADNKGFLDQ